MTSYVLRVFRSVAPLKKNSLIKANKEISSAQSWTALFRAFSSLRQPSAIFSKVFPAEQTSWPNWQTLWACREADG